MADWPSNPLICRSPAIEATASNSLPALVVLGGWFLVQFLNGLMTVSVVTQTGGVAWWAHIGGFVAGMVLMPFFRRKRRVSASPYDVSELWRGGR